MSHDDDSKLQAYEAEGPLDELPRLRQVVARMRAPAGAEEALALRLRRSLGRASRPERSSRKKGIFTLATVVMASVPGLVAAHPDSRHWLRQFADRMVAALPFTHEAPANNAHAVQTVDLPDAVAVTGSASVQTAPLVPGEVARAVDAAWSSSASASNRTALGSGATSSSSAHSSANDPSHGTRSLNGRPEPPSNTPPAVPFPGHGDSTASTAANSTLAAERALLERAQTLCVQGEAAAALALVEEHARRFPNGALVPERLALRARAQSQLGSRQPAWQK